ncbi:cytochrome b/b6 domain-containing protein [Oricola thermophila]|uniref:Cytochrome b/b6 domain-containing protein n=1 Tax=Oricola thermophila TaxID=2742145 RepID=A0A6N1VE92_9HYPH|nr:cytochrome b/b6 domain-containing protein [Oricola thermophila]QKV19260.1 cytochrome b/b6 domain-containing protein [Oricola thermophila]
MTAQAVTEAGGETRPATVRVWDPLVRIFHWSLVGLFAFAFVTGDEWEKAHVAAGYAIAGLIAFRVAWGLVGPRHARFADFVRGPGTILAYLRAMLGRTAPRHLGHNPAGGAMVVALLLAIGGIAATGYMMTTNAFWGVEWVEDVHEALAFGTLGLIALHVGGVILASVEHGENLVRAMITGRKRPL